MARRIQRTPVTPGRKQARPYGGPDMPGETTTDVAEKMPGKPRLSAPQTPGLRSRGFLSQGGSPDGEAPRKARGKKSHADVVTAPAGTGQTPRPGDLTIRAKRLPSLREEKSGDS
ncbi:hypothetical protein [Pannonibacter carbonis]|uniref:hypothetical protein n=1 Tax=Pannonibacter carbonis TaxID=2067569 RepID=UPI000D0E6552|nr:hypothetical protein [Pannonibacter carbonis]